MGSAGFRGTITGCGGSETGLAGTPGGGGGGGVGGGEGGGGGGGGGGSFAFGLPTCLGIQSSMAAGSS